MVGEGGKSCGGKSCRGKSGVGMRKEKRRKDRWRNKCCRNRWKKKWWMEEGKSDGGRGKEWLRKEERVVVEGGERRRGVVKGRKSEEDGKDREGEGSRTGERIET